MALRKKKKTTKTKKKGGPLALVEETKTEDGLPKFIFSDESVLVRDSVSLLTLPDGEEIPVYSGPPPFEKAKPYVDLIEDFYADDESATPAES